VPVVVVTDACRGCVAPGDHRAARTLEDAQCACARARGSTTSVARDLADLVSVDAAVTTVRGIGRPLVALITNAGIANLPTLRIRDGVEMQFLVNQVSQFLLVTRLVVFIPDRTGRIVIVSSSASTEQAEGRDHVRQPGRPPLLQTVHLLWTIEARHGRVCQGTVASSGRTGHRRELPAP